jgi:hypothetical protein
LILLGAFLALALFGAGWDERTQTPLGAHQKRILLAINENTAVAIYNQITFPVLEIRHLVRSLYINAWYRHSRRFTLINH